MRSRAVRGSCWRTQAGDYEKVPIEVRDANKEKVRRPWGLCEEAMGLM